MPANVNILLFDQIEVLDFAGPFEVFSRTRLEPGIESRRSDENAPYRVRTVAVTAEPIRATGGLTVVPDCALDQAPDAEVLIVPGGFGTRALLDDARVLDWIRSAAGNTPTVASVCTGALLLAAAGLLTDKRATTHWGALDALAELDPSIRVQRDQRVVFDGIVTSAGVAAGIDMAFALVQMACGREVADETADYIEYARA